MLLAEGPTTIGVDLGVVLGAASLIISGLATLWLATFKYALAQKEQETNRRFGEVNAENASLRVDVRAMNDRLHIEEKSTIRQDGQIERQKDKHDRVEKDIADIKERVEREMVTKNEMHQLERLMREKLDELLRSTRPGYQPRPTPGGYRGLGEGGSSSGSAPPKKDR